MTSQQGIAALAAEVIRLVQAPLHVEAIMTLPEAARALKVQPCTLRKMVYTGRIGYIADGKNLKFKVSDLNAYLENHYKPSTAMAEEVMEA